jgi:hypothetical protein
VSGLGEGELVSLTLAPALLIAMGLLVVEGGGSASVDARLARRLDGATYGGS